VPAWSNHWPAQVAFAVSLLASPEREDVPLAIYADHHGTRLPLVRQRLRPADAARGIDRVEQHRDGSPYPPFGGSYRAWIIPPVGSFA